MSKYQTMPPLSQDDADALERSIRTHGIQVPVLMDEDGAIIDGHHRWEIGTRCGIQVPTEIREGLTEAQKVALSISLNIDRRQLSSAQKREVIAASVKAEPSKPDNQHAKALGVSPTTVGTIRRDLEESGDVSKLETRTDSLGRQQPASKPSPVVSITTKTTEEVTESFDAQTGEVFDPIVEAVESDQAVQDKRYMHSFYQAMTKADDFLLFDAERVGRLSEQRDFVSVEQFVQSAEKFLNQMRKAGTGLRLVGGTK